MLRKNSQRHRKIVSVAINIPSLDIYAVWLRPPNLEARDWLVDYSFHEKFSSDAIAGTFGHDFRPTVPERKL